MNVGDDLEHISDVFTYRELPWRSFFFGQDYRFADQVGVQSYPTYIVLDRNLKIRSVTHQIDDKVLDELIKSR